MLSKLQSKVDWVKKLKYMQSLKQSVQPKLDPIKLKAQEQTFSTSGAVPADWFGFQTYSHMPPDGFSSPQTHPYVLGVSGELMHLSSWQILLGFLAIHVPVVDVDGRE